MEVRNQNNNSELGKTFRERKKKSFQRIGRKNNTRLPSNNTDGQKLWSNTIKLELLSIQNFIPTHSNKTLIMYEDKIYAFLYMQNLKKMFLSHILSQEITGWCVPPNENINQERTQWIQRTKPSDLGDVVGLEVTRVN